jgi:hypothetical protein
MPDTDGPFGQKIPGFDLEMLDRIWQLSGRTSAVCDKGLKSGLPQPGQAREERRAKPGRPANNRKSQTFTD